MSFCRRFIGRKGSGTGQLGELPAFYYKKHSFFVITKKLLQKTCNNSRHPPAPYPVPTASATPNSCIRAVRRCQVSSST